LVRHRSSHGGRPQCGVQPEGGATALPSEKTFPNRASRVFTKPQVSKLTEAAVPARDAGLNR
jgi:hypothetical protein